MQYVNFLWYYFASVFLIEQKSLSPSVNTHDLLPSKLISSEPVYLTSLLVYFTSELVYFTSDSVYFPSLVAAPYPGGGGTFPPAGWDAGKAEYVKPDPSGGGGGG